MSAIGTFRTQCDVRVESVMRGKADVPVSGVPVGRYRITTPQLRCRPVVRVRLGLTQAHPGGFAPHGQASRGSGKRSIMMMV
jgi:hypothetical protein